MTSSEPVRSMRVDARRNREKVLAAAAELFVTSGADVSLEAIAKHAGVGIGTLYRHFPTRDALVEAVYHDQVERLCDAAEDLRRVHPPDVALAEWLERLVSAVAAKRGMAGALQSVVASNSDLYDHTRTRFLTVIASLLDAAAAAGSIRSDMDADDVLRAMTGIWFVTEEENWRERAQRLLQLLMDGLRYRASSP